MKTFLDIIYSSFESNPEVPMIWPEKKKKKKKKKTKRFLFLKSLETFKQEKISNKTAFKFQR